MFFLSLVLLVLKVMVLPSTIYWFLIAEGSALDIIAVESWMWEEKEELYKISG